MLWRAVSYVVNVMLYVIGNFEFLNLSYDDLVTYWLS